MKVKNSVEGMSGSEVERGYSSEESREPEPDFEERWEQNQKPAPGMLDRKQIVGEITRGWPK